MHLINHHLFSYSPAFHTENILVYIFNMDKYNSNMNNRARSGINGDTSSKKTPIILVTSKRSTYKNIIEPYIPGCHILWARLSGALHNLLYNMNTVYRVFLLVMVVKGAFKSKTFKVQKQ